MLLFVCSEAVQSKPVQLDTSSTVIFPVWLVLSDCPYKMGQPIYVSNCFVFHAAFQYNLQKLAVMWTAEVKSNRSANWTLDTPG